MAKISVDGWEFAYDSVGSGEPIFLLHGLLMDRTMFAHQVAALRERYRVICVDAPGHGESPARPVGFTAEHEAEALVKLAAAIGAGGRAVWGGHSMGGMKAMRVALAHPGSVRALLLIDTQPYPEHPDAVAQYDAMLAAAKDQGPSEDLANLLALIMFSGGFGETPEGKRWVRHLASLDGHAVEGSARTVFDRGDISERLGEITAPALLIHGTDDTPIPIEIARDYVTKLPNGELVEIEGAGHTTPCEKPAEVSRAIAGFLARL
ncbi:MAG: alpha/beta hydrolase [Acidobacteria bacterium]|nr:alpha/beta hydrolase [Acidobacteriota bacterium]